MPEGPLDPLRTRRSALMANYSLVSGSAPVPYLNAHLLNVTTVNMNAWQDKACLNLVWYLNELSILHLLNKHSGLYNQACSVKGLRVKNLKILEVNDLVLFMFFE